MSREQLPNFRYFADPVPRRPFGTPHAWQATAREDESTAAAKLGVEFIERAAIGEYGERVRVPEEVAAELMSRTPVFVTWQDPKWFTHCCDGALYVGPRPLLGAVVRRYW